VSEDAGKAHAKGPPQITGPVLKVGQKVLQITPLGTENRTAGAVNYTMDEKQDRFIRAGPL